MSPSSENARTVQEDCHRLALKPGSSVVYRVKEPINRCRVYSFAPAEANLAISVSADGKNYQSVAVDRSAFPSSQTVYGYRNTDSICRRDRPEATPPTCELKIRASPTDAATDPTPIELSRVEIEYGRTANPAAATPQAPRKRRRNSTASVFVDSDHPLDETLQAIDAAAERGERQANVVVTILVDLTDDLQIKSFGEFAGPDRQYKPFDDAMRNELKDKLRQVFARMVKHDMAIYILPHIDAGGKVRQWRNWVNFDPLEPYAGYTYADLMLGTIADALAEAADADTASKWRYPAKWAPACFATRNRIARSFGNFAPGRSSSN